MPEAANPSVRRSRRSIFSPPRNEKRQSQTGAIFCNQIALAAVVQTIDCKKTPLIAAKAIAIGSNRQLNCGRRTSGSKIATAKSARQRPSSAPR